MKSIFLCFLLLLTLYKVVGGALATESASKAFRITPYVQNPAMDAMTLIWFSNSNRPATLSVRDASERLIKVIESSPVKASALQYSPLELSDMEAGQLTDPPYQHQIRVTGLKPAELYFYQVEQSGAVHMGHFKTAVDANSPIRMIVYADSETEPESTGKHVNWPEPGDKGSARLYIVDQTAGYRENLNVIANRKPDLIAIAGDLVESGGEQRDWDEFWHHNKELAASTPIMPALGNHDYYAGPGDFGGWDAQATEAAVAKFKTYFDLPGNGAENPAHHERYYSLEYGPVTLIVMDPNNGHPHQTPADTNWSMQGEMDGAVAPAWNQGSAQYQWLEYELAKAQQRSRFTFVMLHPTPYTSGGHGRAPGPYSEGRDNTSSLPLQSLTPLFIKYGVDALLSGHDEMLEHSIVTGLQLKPDGGEIGHQLHVYDTGIGGDGLRGPHPQVANPYQHFLAHEDAPEVYDDQGVLVDGGKHYGHLEINVAPNQQGIWQADLDLVYVFPIMDRAGNILRFERRLYDNRTTLIEDQ